MRASSSSPVCATIRFTTDTTAKAVSTRAEASQLRPGQILSIEPRSDDLADVQKHHRIFAELARMAAPVTRDTDATYQGRAEGSRQGIEGERSQGVPD
jgi:hypothetical protein